MFISNKERIKLDTRIDRLINWKDDYYREQRAIVSRIKELEHKLSLLEKFFSIEVETTQPETKYTIKDRNDAKETI